MEPSPTFNKGRAITFLFTTFVSLTWIILLSIVAFARWDATQQPMKSFIAVIILTNLLTVLSLPLLLIFTFRPWLDAARMLLLLTAHIGVGITYAVWYHRLQCPLDTNDTMCQTINMDILAFIWLIPALILFYSTCLAMFVYIRSGSLTAAGAWIEPVERKTTDEERPFDRHFSITTQHLSAPAAIYPGWEGSPPRHPSCIAVGVPTFPDDSPSDDVHRHPSWPSAAWSPPVSHSASRTEWDVTPRYPSGSSLPPGAAVPRPGRQSIPLFAGNRTSHLSELVTIARSETASSAGDSPSSKQGTRKKLAKTSKVYVDGI